MKFIFYLLIPMMLLSLPLYARDSSGGCGLGWEVNDDKSFIGLTTRGTTHYTFVPTFSMTSGTSGCDKHSLVKNEFKGVHYAQANYFNLKTEMPMGNGEFLVGFAHAMGCGSQIDAFGKVMQERYTDIYTSENIDSLQVYQNVLQQIQQDEVLSQSCLLN